MAGFPLSQVNSNGGDTSIGSVAEFNSNEVTLTIDGNTWLQTGSIASPTEFPNARTTTHDSEFLVLGENSLEAFGSGGSIRASVHDDTHLWVYDVTSQDMYQYNFDGTRTSLEAVDLSAENANFLGNGVFVAGFYYLMDQSTGIVRKYNSSWALDASFNLNADFNNPRNIMWDETNQLFMISDFTLNTVRKYNTSFVFQSQITLASGSSFNGMHYDGTDIVASAQSTETFYRFSVTDGSELNSLRVTDRGSFNTGGVHVINGITIVLDINIGFLIMLSTLDPFVGEWTHTRQSETIASYVRVA